VGTGLNTPALLFGIILLVASIGLFFWGRLKPELARDSDNVYSVIGIICSVILFTSAFDLSLILGFQQLLLIGAVIALMWENIQKREPMALAPRREDDRSPRRPYRAEYEETGYSGNAGARFSGSDDRGGRGLPRRDYYDDRTGSAPKNDRYLGSEEPKPSRDAGRGSRRNRDEESKPRDNSWGDEPPRTMPERSSRGDRPVGDRGDRPVGDRPSRDRGAMNDSAMPDSRRGNENGDVERPRRRRPEEGSDRPARRPKPNREDIPAADFVEFTPEPKDKGSSWGPQD
jgi:Ycf66 protein N-terminus